METEIRAFEDWISQGKQGNLPLDTEKWKIAVQLTDTAVEINDIQHVGGATAHEAKIFPETMETVTSPVVQPVTSQSQPIAEDITAETATIHEQFLNNNPDSQPDADAPENKVDIDFAAVTWLAEARLATAESENIDQLKEALRLCDEVINSSSESLYSEADQVRAKARGNLEHLLQQALKQGQEEEKNNDVSAARAVYRRALHIDSNNEIAKNALLGLDQKDYNALSRQEVLNLRLGLAVRDDITRLGKAVYECELRQTLGISLPDELKQLLPEARRYFDEIRKKDGQVITQAREGKLVASKQAIEYFEDLSITGRKDTVDPIRGPRTISEAIDEANAIWRQRSDEFVQDILLKIKANLPEKPRTAKGILEKERYEEDRNTHERILRPIQQDAAAEVK